MEAFVKNAADEAQVKEAGQKVKRGRELELGDFRGIMDSLSGRRFVYRYISKCGVFEQSFTGNNTTFFNEGQRSIGLSLMADINEACPELYMRMIEESRAKNKEK
jgi:hypothetical protein